MRIETKITKSATGTYRAWCPSLPGCEATGASREEAMAGIRQAMDSYVASLDSAMPCEPAHPTRSEQEILAV